jgi:15,16-dihydrobiliverdin:ferredoxin oxidoreductase
MIKTKRIAIIVNYQLQTKTTMTMMQTTIMILMILGVLISNTSYAWMTTCTHEILLPRCKTRIRTTTHRNVVGRPRSVDDTVPMSVALMDPPEILTPIDDGYSQKYSVDSLEEDLESVFDQHGLPWQSSIDPSIHEDEPFYQPFFEWQIDYMKIKLHNLRLVPTTDRSETQDLTYVDNLHRTADGTTKKRPHRMITLRFTSDEYRLIRLTLLDGGGAVQVFTSLWYPDGNVNLPVLGIDLLQFSNATRHLTVVDFQPIQPSEKDHDLAYEHLLEPIRNRYPTLQHTMSQRFYDESDGFFSRHTLLGKGNRTDYVFDELWPAYQDYVRTHVGLVQECHKANQRNDQKDTAVQPLGLQGQKRYDDYSSVRDPAHGLLANIFGREYADDFVFDVLFPLCEKPNQ